MSTIEALASQELAGFSGIVLRPGDAGYDDARQVYNAMFDRRPALIAQCRNTADVAAAVRFARAHGLPLAVRGGGHSIAGFSVCDDGVVIDLSLMKHIDVDPDERTARAQPGVLLGELDAATQQHGLATPLGFVSVTGIAGLTLNGGMGFLARKHGLSCDNLIAAEVVLADGTVVHASDTENADLMWGLRGGGGNFGIVTNFEYRLHEVSEVYVDMRFYEPSALARPVAGVRRRRADAARGGDRVRRHVRGAEQRDVPRGAARQVRRAHAARLPRRRSRRESRARTTLGRAGTGVRHGDADAVRRRPDDAGRRTCRGAGRTTGRRATSRRSARVPSTCSSSSAATATSPHCQPGILLLGGAVVAGGRDRRPPTAAATRRSTSRSTTSGRTRPRTKRRSRGAARSTTR